MAMLEHPEPHDVAAHVEAGSADTSTNEAGCCIVCGARTDEPYRPCWPDECVCHTVIVHIVPGYDERPHTLAADCVCGPTLKAPDRPNRPDAEKDWDVVYQHHALHHCDYQYVAIPEAPR